MPPKRNKFRPFEAGKTFTGQSFTPGQTPSPVTSPFVPAGVRSGTPSAIGSAIGSTAGSGTSTPRSTSSSTVNLNALAKALEQIGESPISENFEQIKDAKNMGEVRAAVQAGASVLEKDGPSSVEKYHFIKGVSALLKAKGSALIREGAYMFISTVARTFGPKSLAQAYLVDCFALCFDGSVDKDAAVKKAALNAINALQDMYTPEALISSVLTVILTYLKGSAKWQSKITALQTTAQILEKAPQDEIDGRFIDAVPVLTTLMTDFKPELAKEGHATLKLLMTKLDNQDVAPRIDVVITGLADPKKVQDTVKTLSAVTFIADVTESTLSVLVPILSRALSGFSSQESLRQTVTVTENLTRLVHNPHEIAPFISELKPGVERVVESASLPEVRELGSKALDVLKAAEAEEGERTKATLLEASGSLSEVKDSTIAEFFAPVVQLCINVREFDKLKEVYELLGVSDIETVVNTFENMFSDSRPPDVVEDGVEIVNAKFSLAYGGRMLLNKTVLRLYKGRRYGLCGRNGAGKSTLMRQIAEGKLEGFPDKSELRTCFVEHRLQGSEADLDLVDFIALDEEINASKEEIASALAEVGFDDERRKQNVGALSGGWKMKLELARAMLMKADILLLDEPTNHLDVANVKWLEDYLVDHTDITSLIVSHDSGFLDAVCTDIIHYEQKKLVYYKGNLSDFVKVKPEGKAYYTLTDSNVKMAFPPPGILSGVRSNTRAIARMSDVSFTYPGASKPSLEHVSCSVSLSSRVAVLGPNGAGKSTLIKLLTGELIPNSGTVEKHPNLRIGYIAQHAFQHVEKHKEKTANQYLQWRYQNGDDREVHLKQTRQFSEEETAALEKPQDLHDGGPPRRLQALIGRQKLKKSFQYEVQWVGYLPKHNTWMTKDELAERGFAKLVQAFDDHEASREGLGYRELIPPVIRKHFEDVGLDGDIADHTPLGSLSGGQLVKVVIAGATWNNPHLLVLDEPTNYLDRDSLGGLAVAIRDWSGGVLLISHNNEFTGALCPEQWIINDGKMVTKNKSDVNAESFADSADGSAVSSAQASAAASASASAANSDSESPLNIKIRKKKKKLTRNEQKERDTRRRLRYLEWLASPKGTPKPEDSDSD